MKFKEGKELEIEKHPPNYRFDWEDEDDGREENKIELAWAAGFYDGEGSVSCTANNGNPYTRVQMSIGQKNDAEGNVCETLRRFLTAVGIGKIYAKSVTGKEINMSQYQVCRRIEVESVLLALWPYISEVKKVQAKAAFRLLDSGIKQFKLKARTHNENF